MLPIAMPALAAAAFTFAVSMCDGSSMGISTVSKPQRLNVVKSFVLSVVNGEVKRKVLMPILILWGVEGKGTMSAHVSRMWTVSNRGAQRWFTAKAMR